LDLPGLNGSHKNVVENMSKKMMKKIILVVCFRKGSTVNAMISIILVCPKGIYLSKIEFLKLILTLVILPL